MPHSARSEMQCKSWRSRFNLGLDWLIFAALQTALSDCWSEVRAALALTGGKPGGFANRGKPVTSWTHWQTLLKPTEGKQNESSESGIA